MKDDERRIREAVGEGESFADACQRLDIGGSRATYLAKLLGDLAQQPKPQQPDKPGPPRPPKRKFYNPPVTLEKDDKGDESDNVSGGRREELHGSD